ncbi:MAG: hypothetical protein ACKO1N_09950 [Erythrobacter sp.]
MRRYALRLGLTFVQYGSLGFLTALAARFLTDRLTGTAYLASLASLAVAVVFVWRWSRNRIDQLDPRDPT